MHTALLFPELSMIGATRFGVRKPAVNQLVFPSMTNADYQRYTLVLKQQTPARADKKAINEFYKLAKKLTRETGELHTVDHIVPLTGGIVCGLHVEYNLQVLHWRANANKGARRWPNMPQEQLEML